MGKLSVQNLSIKSPVTETIHSLQQFMEIFSMEMIKNEWWRKKNGRHECKLLYRSTLIVEILANQNNQPFLLYLDVSNTAYARAFPK